MAEVPLFPTTHSPVLTYLPYLEFRLYDGKHHSHNFLSRDPDSRSHRRASTLAYYNDRLSGFRIGRWGSRIGICFKSGAKSWNTSGCRRIRSDHGFFLYNTLPKSGYHQHFPNVLTRISLLEFQRILLDSVSTLLPPAPFGELICAPNHFPEPENLDPFFLTPPPHSHSHKY